MSAMSTTSPSNDDNIHHPSRYVHERRDDWPFSGGGFSDERIEELAGKYGLDGASRDFLRALRIDADTQHTIMNAEQKSDDWFAARNHRITASNYAAAIDHHKYSSPSEAVEGMLWKTFKGNAATEWGCLHEDDGASTYERYMRRQRELQGLDPKAFRCTFPGLVVPLSFPWAGCSPDGFVWIDGKLVGGLEIKCPYRKKLYPFIPAYYYDQIQGTMGFLGMKWWDFAVWTPTQTQIRRFHFDPKYWETILYPRLEEFYMTQYLPAALLKQQGRLAEGAIEETLDVDVDVTAGDLDAAEPAAKCAGKRKRTEEPGPRGLAAFNMAGC